MEATFTAIAVKTANPDPASICQIGIVQVVDGEITKEGQTLINPEYRFFPEHIDTHGITQEMVIESPKIPDFRSTVGDELKEQLLVTHTSFVQTSLHLAMDRYGLQRLEVDWLDSRNIARFAWPELDSHSLAHVAKHLGLKLPHREALQEAKVVSQIVLRAHQDKGFESFLDLPAPPPQGIRLEDPLYGSDELTGKAVMFAGKLSIPRRRIRTMVTQAGGKVRRGFSEKTPTLILVINPEDPFRLKYNERPQKEQDAEHFIQKGRDIRILSETEFLELIPKVLTGYS